MNIIHIVDLIRQPWFHLSKITNVDVLELLASNSQSGVIFVSFMHRHTATSLVRISPIDTNDAILVL